MPVIAMTQEMGSLAKDVALQLAQTMGLAVMRHEVADRVAGELDLPKSLIHRLRGGKAGLVERLKADQRSIALYTADELFSLADRGNVVLRGWGATVLLRPVPHVVCVRITRSFAKRVEWVMADLDTDDVGLAEAEVRRSDRAHASRMNDLFGVTWGDPVLYDLTLNTDRVSIDSCVEQIRLMTTRPEFAETAESHALLDAMALEARVRVALKQDEVTRDIEVTIQANHGRVALQGIVLDAEERSRAESVAAGAQGVVSVDNQLRLMSHPKKFMSSKQT
ncbi:cytidylate kinase family protein [Piscinibacter sp. XHJ-5]|uniref:cytidylate kinase family protein n=1 Tax=Piscinibacter sp. XHJ-5 TaxID=3037797 RepID=UPI002453620D|nr:cytidylate kinase family protein [Piscinibacter sp. XHJ-5]